MTDYACALLCLDLALVSTGERREYWTHRANWFLESAWREATSCAGGR
jgi:hypothetical protein